jgi:hypothetical protein
MYLTWKNRHKDFNAPEAAHAALVMVTTLACFKVGDWGPLGVVYPQPVIMTVCPS